MKGKGNMEELIKRQDAIDVVAKAYRYESDRLTALQELPTVDVEKMIVCNCGGCKNNNTDECMHCMRAYTDCYEK